MNPWWILQLAAADVWDGGTLRRAARGGLVVFCICTALLWGLLSWSFQTSGLGPGLGGTLQESSLYRTASFLLLWHGLSAFWSPFFLALSSLFLVDGLVAAGLQNHYASRHQVSPRFTQSLRCILKHLWKQGWVNVLFLPVYGVLLFLPPLLAVTSFLINGFFFAALCYELVGLRYPFQIRSRLHSRLRSGGRPVFVLVSAGFCAQALSLLFPLSLVVPVFFAFYSVHLFHLCDTIGEDEDEAFRRESRRLGGWDA